MSENKSLDLSAITPRMYAMSYPSENFIESMYHNDQNDIAEYFNKKHPNKYLIFNLSGIPSNVQYVDVDSNLSDKEFREKYLTSKLSTKEKMDFYHSVINNDLESFKSFIYGTPTRAPYDIFEEVSQK
jgi:hypothetical protein